MPAILYRKHGPRVPHSVRNIYLIGFLVGLHMALPAYLYSTFLSQFFPERYVGIIFSIAALLTIWMFSKLPLVLKRFGNFRTTLAFLALSIASVALLALIKSPLLVIGLFMIYEVAIVVLVFNLDIFLERISNDNVTGEIRGTYLTFTNAAWVISQIAASFLITDSQYTRLLLIAAAVAIPAFIIISKTTRKFTDPVYHHLPAFKLFSLRGQKHQVVSVYTLNFLLQFFYSWMVIYTPIYLHNYVGFSWSAIALLFAVMLTPFVLIQRPLGEIADRLLGEREFLTAGFLIMAGTTGMMTFATEPNFWVWMILLFVSRIGAATAEVMSETFFFKHVHASDVTLIGLFRTTKPWAYIVGPIIATVLLPFVSIQYLFLILGCIMFYGAFKASGIVDTK